MRTQPQHVRIRERHVCATCCCTINAQHTTNHPVAYLPEPTRLKPRFANPSHPSRNTRGPQKHPTQTPGTTYNTHTTPVQRTDAKAPLLTTQPHELCLSKTQRPSIMHPTRIRTHPTTHQTKHRQNASLSNKNIPQNTPAYRVHNTTSAHQQNTGGILTIKGNMFVRVRARSFGVALRIRDLNCGPHKVHKTCTTTLPSMFRVGVHTLLSAKSPKVRLEQVVGARVGAPPEHHLGTTFGPVFGPQKVCTYTQKMLGLVKRALQNGPVFGRFYPPLGVALYSM